MSISFSFDKEKDKIKKIAENQIDLFIEQKRNEKNIKIQNNFLEKYKNRNKDDFKHCHFIIDFSKDEIKDWSTLISESLITKLNEIYPYIKIITFCSILEAGDNKLLFSSSNWWNYKTDGYIFIEKKDMRPKIFVGLYFLYP